MEEKKITVRVVLKKEQQVTTTFKETEVITGSQVKDKMSDCRGVPKEQQVVVVLSPDEKHIEKVIHDETRIDLSDIENVHVLELHRKPVKVNVKIRWTCNQEDGEVNIDVSPDSDVNEIQAKIKTKLNGIIVQKCAISLNDHDITERTVPCHSFSLLKSKL